MGLKNIKIDLYLQDQKSSKKFVFRLTRNRMLPRILILVSFGYRIIFFFLICCHKSKVNSCSVRTNKYAHSNKFVVELSGKY